MQPEAVDVCDGIDQNCNGETDEGAVDVRTSASYFHHVKDLGDCNGDGRTESFVGSSYASTYGSGLILILPGHEIPDAGSLDLDVSDLPLHAVAA